MRVIGMTLLIALLINSCVFAMAPVNSELIKAAQEYGKANCKASLQEFLLPWTAYEEQAFRLDEKAERAYLYTPFLLIAVDARAKQLSAKQVSLADSEKVLNEYTGFLTFSAQLIGATDQFYQGCKVVLRQGKKTISAYDTRMSDTVVLSSAAGKPQYSVQGYFYFLEKGVDLTKPVTLIITTADNREHRFYFDLVRIK